MVEWNRRTHPFLMHYEVEVKVVVLNRRRTQVGLMQIQSQKGNYPRCFPNLTQTCFSTLIYHGNFIQNIFYGFVLFLKLTGNT